MEDKNTIGQIKELLDLCKLPSDDIISSNVVFISKKDKDHIVACIGIEEYHKEGLLRSFAVHDAYRNRGIGITLLQELIDTSRKKGIERLHLLTTTAQTYFEKHDFVVSHRDKAPPTIALSKEFSELCPSSSTYMVRDIRPTINS